MIYLNVVHKRIELYRKSQERRSPPIRCPSYYRPIPPSYIIIL